MKDQDRQTDRLRYKSRQTLSPPSRRARSEQENTYQENFDALINSDFVRVCLVPRTCSHAMSRLSAGQLLLETIDESVNILPRPILVTSFPLFIYLRTTINSLPCDLAKEQ